MRLYQREGSPFWWYEFSVNGNRHRESTKRTSKAQANAVMAAAYQGLLNESQLGHKPDITVEAAFDVAIATAQGNTATSYTYCKNKWCGLAFFGKVDRWKLPTGMKMSELQQRHLDDHRSARRKEGLRDNSINIEIRVMQRVYNVCAKRYRVTPDLSFDKLDKFTKTRFLSTHEQEAIAAALGGHNSPAYTKAYQLLIVLLDTGLRLGEALSLEWADVDMTRKQIEAFRQKTRTVSVVPMTNRVTEIFARQQNQPKPFDEMSRGVRLLRIAIDKECNNSTRVVDQRGKATIHSLRDTFASRLVREGMSLHQLAKLLGHSSAAMSAKYAHLESADVAETARRILNGSHHA